MPNTPTLTKKLTGEGDGPLVEEVRLFLVGLPQAARVKVWSSGVNWAIEATWADVK